MRDDLALVQTVDFFTPIVDDPYTYGAIAVANSLSDVYAMGGTPVTALNIVCYPKSTVGPDILTEILRGGHDKAMQASCLIIGGHSVEDQEMKYGLAVTGTIDPERILTNANARPGDALVLTKPIGTGIVTTALKLGEIPASLYTEVTEAMLQLNAAAAVAAVRFDAHACTDITGFSLLGHAWSMAAASQAGMVFYADKIRLFPGTEELAGAGHLTKGDRTNREYVGANVRLDDHISENIVHALYDPQTSGGLLISVSAEAAEELVAELHSKDVSAAAIIGRVTHEHPGKILVTQS